MTEFLLRNAVQVFTVRNLLVALHQTLLATAVSLFSLAKFKSFIVVRSEADKNIVWFNAFESHLRGFNRSVGDVHVQVYKARQISPTLIYVI